MRNSLKLALSFSCLISPMVMQSCSSADDAVTKPKTTTTEYQGGQAESGTPSENGEVASTTSTDGLGSEATPDGQAPKAIESARADCKRGGAYGYHSQADLKEFAKGSSWWYNWSPAPDKDIGTSYASMGIEFVPMIWHGNFNVADTIKAIPSDSKYLLVFNEPNFKSQTNLSPTDAAAKWPEVQQIAKAKNLKIVAPAVNYCGPAGDCHETNPYTYLDKFFAACKNCQIDYIAVHWYACKGEYLTDYLKGFEKYNKPMWVTEFSCGDGDASEKSLAGQKAYMTEALKVLEANPKVFRYSWFASRTTAIPNVNLLGASGELTDLGKQYNSAATQVAGACSL